MREHICKNDITTCAAKWSQGEKLGSRARRGLGSVCVGLSYGNISDMDLMFQKMVMIGPVQVGKEACGGVSGRTPLEVWVSWGRASEPEGISGD